MLRHPHVHSALIALLVALVAVFVLAPKTAQSPGTPGQAAGVTESTFDRVMRTRTIRCGYYVFPPVTYRDPNTRELSGFTVDMMNEIGRRAGLKIEWAEETNFVTWTESLKAGRFDVACTPNWPDTPLATVITFGTPMFYAGLYPMVRADDARFKDGVDVMKALNSPGITFTTIEGNAIDGITRNYFPKAKTIVQPKSAGDSSFVLDVLTMKADVLLIDQNGKVEFNRANPGKLRLIDSVPPVKMMPFVLAVDRNEMILKDFLDNAVHDLIYDGTMDRMLRQWEPEPGKTFLRVALPIDE
jgi:polar amino acid transport system substrate-binding protein